MHVDPLTYVAHRIPISVWNGTMQQFVRHVHLKLRYRFYFFDHTKMSPLVFLLMGTMMAFF
jgi:hypothetical protein